MTSEFLRISLPALIQLTAEPLASLVDTYYLSKLGPTVLGGAGVAITGGYALGKIVGDPVLRCCISLVASSSGDEKKLSTNVTVALLLALTIGIAQSVFYLFNSKNILLGLGVPQTSTMYAPAFSYMMVRGFALPASMLWLVVNGVYRGIGDTVTPLVWSCVFTALNVILDPIFMFRMGMGSAGAAMGTAVAQYIALIPLLVKMSSKVGLVNPLSSEVRGPFLKSLRSYLSASARVCVRSTLKVSTYAYTSRLSALLGPIQAAAYNLCFQIGFVTTQCCESIAVATQTLLAREFGKEERERRGDYIRKVIGLSCWSGGLLSAALSLLTYFNRSSVISKLSSDPGVRAACYAIFPAVLICQALKGLAYPANGVVMGGSDWTYSMITMGIANLFAAAVLGSMGRMGEVGLKGIWWALAGFMGTQVMASAIRVKSKTGVWKCLKKD